MKTSLWLLGCVGWLLSGSTVAGAADNADALRVELRGNGGNAPFFAPNHANLLHFLLFANAESRIYSEVNNWGYANRSFNAVTADQQKAYKIYRKAHPWRSDGPTTLLIKKGDFLIFNVDLCDGTWAVQPPLYLPPGESLTLTGRFRIEPGPDALRDDVWTGDLATSTGLEAAFDEKCLNRLNNAAP